LGGLEVVVKHWSIEFAQYNLDESCAPRREIEKRPFYRLMYELEKLCLMFNWDFFEAGIRVTSAV